MGVRKKKKEVVGGGWIPKDQAVALSPLPLRWGGGFKSLP